MRGRKPFAPSDEFKIRPGPGPDYARARKSFSLRHHPVLTVILLNICSVFVILFLVSGGHPLDKIGQVFRGLADKTGEDGLPARPPSPAELLAKDLSIARESVNSQYGENRFMGLEDISHNMEALKKRYPAIRNSRGNLLLKADGRFYYLSADAQRLYLCLVDIPREAERSRPR